LVKAYDAIIVGGGIIGTSLALELRNRGLSVLVVDRQTAGQEASWAAAGMLAPDPESQNDHNLLPLSRMSLAEYPGFIAAVEESSGLLTEFRNDGALKLYFGADGEDERNRGVESHRAVGLSTEPVSLAQAREIETAISAEVTSAAWLPYECSVNPRALTQAVLTSIERKGVELLQGLPVYDLSMRGGRCTGVVVGNETFAAARVIIAAGCFSIEVSDLIARYAPTSPVRGQIVALTLAQGAPRHVLRGPNGYVVPRTGDRLIAGSTSEYVGFEKRVTAQGIAQILAAATQLSPNLASAAIAESWSGLRPDTPDHLPILGPTDIEGLWIATGHYRNGILLAPGTARLMAEWITEGKPSLSLETFSPLRFAAEQKIAAH
jgi:glycine oxidase